MPDQNPENANSPAPSEAAARSWSKSAKDMPKADEALNDARVVNLAERLLHGGLRELTEREQRVIATIARRQSVTQNVNQTIEDHETFGDQLADRVAHFGGSWTFILVFIAALAAWVGLNSLMVARSGTSFDVYPYIFLNLILSMIAALQAPIILMSQNRQADRDRLSAGLDYEVNLKSELEIMGLHDKLDAMRIDRLEHLLEEQRLQLCRLLEQAHAATDSPRETPPSIEIDAPDEIRS